MTYHTPKSLAWAKYNRQAWRGLDKVAEPVGSVPGDSPARVLVALAGENSKITEARPIAAS